MTISSGCKKNNFADAENALSEASKFLSRLCKSRKAGMRLSEITNYTREVARLARALKQGTEHDDGHDDGYGDPDHYAKISKTRDTSGLIR